MAYEVKTWAPCDVCGEPTQRRLNKTRKPCCLVCATKNVAAAATEMHYRNGAAYDKWRAAMQKVASMVGPTSTPSANEIDQAERLCCTLYSGYDIGRCGACAALTLSSVFPVGDRVSIQVRREKGM